MIVKYMEMIMISVMKIIVSVCIIICRNGSGYNFSKYIYYWTNSYIILIIDFQFLLLEDEFVNFHSSIMGKRTHDVLPMVVISPGVNIVSKDLAEKTKASCFILFFLQWSPLLCFLHFCGRAEPDRIERPLSFAGRCPGFRL